MTERNASNGEFVYEDGLTYFDREPLNKTPTSFSDMRAVLYPGWGSRDYSSLYAPKSIIAHRGTGDDNDLVGWVSYALFDAEYVAEQIVSIEYDIAGGMPVSPLDSVTYGRIFAAGTTDGLKITSDVLVTLINRAEAIIKQNEFRLKGSSELNLARGREWDRLIAWDKERAELERQIARERLLGYVRKPAAAAKGFIGSKVNDLRARREPVWTSVDDKLDTAFVGYEEFPHEEIFGSGISGKVVAQDAHNLISGEPGTGKHVSFVEDDEAQHGMIFGSAGSGKTAAFRFPPSDVRIVDKKDLQDMIDD